MVKKNKTFYNKKEDGNTKTIIGYVLVSLLSSIMMYVFLTNNLIINLQSNLLVIALIIFAVVMIFGLGLGLFIIKITTNNEIDEAGYIDVTEKNKK